VGMPARYDNGTARAATAFGDDGTLSKSGSTECTCMAVLTSCEGLFASVRRT